MSNVRARHRGASCCRARAWAPTGTPLESSVDDLASILELVAPPASFRPLVYTGDMGAAARDRAIETFKQDGSHGALVLSLRAGGQGLNLAEASYVIPHPNDTGLNTASVILDEIRCGHTTVLGIDNRGA